MCNLSFLVSLLYISFSKASVLYWTCPIFTALMSKFYLNERLSYFDWVAAITAFIGIIIIQNPFGERAKMASGTIQGEYDDLIGTAIGLFGAFIGAWVNMFIRKLSNYQKMHFLIGPMAFTLGNVILCPVFLTIKVLVSPIDPINQVQTEQHTIGTSLHVYNRWDVTMIILLGLMIYFT